jgi:hypothetical protein
MNVVLRAKSPTDTHVSGDIAMSALHEALARERMREHERLVADARTRRVASRLAAARRLQRRAESASGRARALLLSL